MYQDGFYLMDLISPSYDMISDALTALEPRERIHVLFRGVESDRQVFVRLPRFRLDFFVNEDHHLEARQLRGMVLDTDQDIGTFYGLRNRLVLKYSSPHSNIRTVIVPHGVVKFTPTDGHLAITVDGIINTDHNNQPRVQYYQYHIDHTLCRLVGGNDHSNMYYKAYLHAVTSYCLSDPLTNKTGTEEALDILRSARALSFQKLTPAALSTLELISKLSARRVFYPEHLKVMEQVEWSCLPPLSQHEWFEELVQSIIAHYRKMCVFQPEHTPQLAAWKGQISEQQLIDKALNRNAFFRTEDYGDRLSGHSEDRPYSRARDLPPFIHEVAIYDVARLVQVWPSALDTHDDLLGVLQTWNVIAGPVHDFSLHYDRKWLQIPGGNIASDWLSLFDWCRRCIREQNSYQLLFVLCATVHAGVDSRLIQTLLAFATVPNFRTLQPPSYTSYDLSYGFEPKKDEISNILRRESFLPFERSSEYQLWDRTSDASWARAVDIWRANLQLEIEKHTEYIVSLWSSESLVIPRSSFAGYRLIDHANTSANEQIDVCFRNWFRNLKLREHVLHVQSVLKHLRRADSTPFAYFDFKPNRIAHVSNRSIVSIEDLLCTNSYDKWDAQSYHSIRLLQVCNDASDEEHH